MTYTVLTYKADEGETGYWAKVAELPGCATQGESVEEIEANVKDAIEEYFHALRYTGQPLPPPVEYKLEVAVA
jgi:predicted RNase H-like HicB family nuclease